MRRFWVILLLVALLPLRAWAAAGMVAPVPAPQAPAAAAEMLPCHAELSEDAATQTGPDAARIAHLCSSCDLCHAPLAVPAPGWAGPEPLPSAGPPAAHPRDTGRLLAACLERPPRA